MKLKVKMCDSPLVIEIKKGKGIYVVSWGSRGERLKDIEIPKELVDAAVELCEDHARLHKLRVEDGKYGEINKLYSKVVYNSQNLNKRAMTMYGEAIGRQVYLFLYHPPFMPIMKKV